MQLASSEGMSEFEDQQSIQDQWLKHPSVCMLNWEQVQISSGVYARFVFPPALVGRR
jgi:hypothetical protein